MPAKKIRIATIGTWGHLGQVLAELVPLPKVQVVAHARSMPDDDVSVVRAMTGDQTIPWFEDYHRMLAEVRPDVAVISTRLDRINPIAIDAAEAGCHLICEKPLAIEQGPLARLYEVCIAKKVQCVAMLGNGRHPAMLAAAAVIRSGAIGQAVLLNARKSYKWGTRPDWFGDNKMYGTTLSWIAIHGLEMIHVLSDQEFTTVAAMQSNIVNTERKDCQDNGVILLGLTGGGHASVSFDYLRPPAAATHGDDWVRVVGSKGVIEINLDRGFCRLITADSPERDIPLPASGPFYSTFIDSLIAGVPTPEMRRAFMLTHVCLRAADAAEKKSVEAIGPMPWDLRPPRGF